MKFLFAFIMLIAGFRVDSSTFTGKPDDFLVKQKLESGPSSLSSGPSTCANVRWITRSSTV